MTFPVGAKDLTATKRTKHCFECGHVIGIDLTADKEFLQSLELLIEQIKSIR